VIVVGHSSGGAAITLASAGKPAVSAIVTKNVHWRAAEE
jgi:hypothetical protein